MAAYYFSLQMSAIQKTVERHDRLWSLSGISQCISELIEILLPQAVRRHSGQVLIAGGGKLTASFESRQQAEAAKKECIREVATLLPMLEFQSSEIIEAASLKAAKQDSTTVPGIISALNEQKAGFRGYGVSFNPLLEVCSECGEYPAIADYRKDGRLCSVCYTAWKKAGLDMAALSGYDDSQLTTIERIYRNYARQIHLDSSVAIPLDFENLVSADHRNDDEKRRMAVWVSDLNSMNDKVRIWLEQPEKDIKPTFDRVKDAIIDITVSALTRTFPRPTSNHIPFRIIIAGGDDFCVVMDEKHVLDFAVHLADSFDQEQQAWDETHPLSRTWLEQKRAALEREAPGQQYEIKPFCFGGSFVITSYHTPFKKIHQACETLMKEAKQHTDRQGNSINWKVMEIEGDAEAEPVLRFEKPLFISDIPGAASDRLSFKTYLQMRRFYLNQISSSKLQQIVSKMIAYSTHDEELTRQMRIWAGKERVTTVGLFLSDENLYRGETFQPARLATLFELMNIKRSGESR